MLRKLLILAVCAGSSASVPMLYEANPEAFLKLLRPSADEATPEPVPTPVVKTAQPVARAESLSGRKVRLVADERGHFTADFKFNGRKVDAMIDTGATLVAINLSTARRIGLTIMPADFKYAVDTANGQARAAAATIGSLEIGRILVKDVPAMVLDDRALKGTLIGVSFLSKLGKYQVEDGALLLVQ